MRNSFKTSLIAISSLAAITVGGCVSSGTYQAKEQESLELKKSLLNTKGDYSELQEKNKKLAEDYETALTKLKKINADFAEIKAENEKLKLENEKLATAVKPENLLKSFTDAFTMLQAENAKLKQAFASAAGGAEKKEAELPVKLTPVVAKPAVSPEEGGSSQIKSSGGLSRESTVAPDEQLKKPSADSK